MTTQRLASLQYAGLLRCARMDSDLCHVHPAPSLLRASRLAPGDGVKDKKNSRCVPQMGIQRELLFLKFGVLCRQFQFLHKAG